MPLEANSRSVGAEQLRLLVEYADVFAQFTRSICNSLDNFAKLFAIVLPDSSLDKFAYKESLYDLYL